MTAKLSWRTMKVQEEIEKVIEPQTVFAITGDIALLFAGCHY